MAGGPWLVSVYSQHNVALSWANLPRVLTRIHHSNHIITALVSNQFSTTTADGLSPTGARPSTDAIITWHKPVCQSFNGDTQKATVLCPKRTMAIIIKKISAERLALTRITRDIISNSRIFPIDTTATGFPAGNYHDDWNYAMSIIE